MHNVRLYFLRLNCWYPHYLGASSNYPEHKKRLRSKKKPRILIDMDDENISFFTGMNIVVRR